MDSVSVQMSAGIRLHFIPAYCLHLNPIERLWGLMPCHVTHNKCYATYSGFCTATLQLLRQEAPTKWHTLYDSMTDNFRVTSPKEFWVIV